MAEQAAQYRYIREYGGCCITQMYEPKPVRGYRPDRYESCEGHVWVAWGRYETCQQCGLKREQSQPAGVTPPPGEGE